MMASSYSTALLLELMATGDQSGTWGTTTNTNLGTLLEQAITGVLSVAQGDVANLTLTSINGTSDQARNAVIILTGAMTAGRNVVVPTSNKLYLVKNSTTGGFAVTVKTVAGTGVSIAAATSQWVYCDGVNVVAGLNAALALDANSNLTVNNLLEGYATTATAAGTTTFTVASTYQQFFTGSTTQTVVMPVTSTLVLGQAFWVQNLSTGAVTVNSSGSNAILVLAGSTAALFTCILTSGTSAASWSAVYFNEAVASGKKFGVSNSITLAGTDATTMTFPSTSDTVVGLTVTQTLTNKSLQSSTTTVVDNVDATKKIAFAASGITTGTTRTWTAQDASGTVGFIDLASQVITGGGIVTSNAVGTVSSGTTTLNPGTRPMWDYTNGGAHTLAPGSNKGSIILDITNNGSAGAITTSGWTKVVGAFDTTNAHVFRCFCSIGAAGSLLTIQAMQ
jgi:hypothetical protein